MYHVRGTVWWCSGKSDGPKTPKPTSPGTTSPPTKSSKPSTPGSRLAVPGRENTTEILGTTTAGRHLLVVATEATDGRDYIITARDMSPTEKRTFRAKGH